MVKFIKEHSGKISLFNLIMFIRLVCGFYNHISSSKAVQFLARVYCILLYGLAIFMLKYYMHRDWLFLIVFIFAFISYTINSAICFYTGDRHLHSYQSDIKIIDNIMKWKSCDLRWTLFSLLNVLLKLFFNLMIKFIQNRLTLISFMRTLFLHLLFVNAVSHSIVFELLWKRLQYIRQAIESGHEVEDVQRKYQTLKQISLVYKNLLTSVEEALKAFKLTVPFGLLSILIGTTAHTHRVIFDGVATGDVLSAILNTLNLLLGLVVYCSMLFFAELVLDEFDQIKGALGYEIFLCSDKSLRKLLYEIVEYMQARPPKFTVLRVFPLTLKLFIAVVGACVTYVIMILQFRL